MCYSSSLGREVEIELGLVKPFLMGKDVKRYVQSQPNNVVIFPYVVDDGKAELMPLKYIKDNYPNGYDYLIENKKELEGREHGKMKGSGFYAYIYPKNLAEFETPKISTPEIAIKPQMTFDDDSMYHTTKVYSFSFMGKVKESHKYFLGVLNSNMLWFFLNSTGYVLRGGYFTFKTEYLKPFPIKLINFSDKTEKLYHDKIVKLVDELLLLNVNTEKNKTKIDAAESEINDIVYRLYGITDKKEIELIESC